MTVVKHQASDEGMLFIAFHVQCVENISFFFVKFSFLTCAAYNDSNQLIAINGAAVLFVILSCHLCGKKRI